MSTPKALLDLEVAFADGSRALVCTGIACNATTAPWQWSYGEITRAWIGAEKSLEFLCSVPMAERTGWCVGLADHLAARLGLTPTGSSILAIPLVRPERARAALKEVGITTSGRGPRIRASFHLYNDMSEANLIAEVIQPFVDSRDSHQLGVRTP